MNNEIGTPLKKWVQLHNEARSLGVDGLAQMHTTYTGGLQQGTDVLRKKHWKMRVSDHIVKWLTNWIARNLDTYVVIRRDSGGTSVIDHGDDNMAEVRVYIFNFGSSINDSRTSLFYPLPLKSV